MNLNSLRRRCRARLREADIIPRPFDISELCARLADRRGRPLHLLPTDLSAGGPSGMWISAEQGDYIVYEQATSPLHQEHIVLHEVGHMLCGHEGGTHLTRVDSQMLFPRLDPATVSRVLGRSASDSAEEREAEMIASLVLERAERSAVRGVAAAGPREADDRLRQLEFALMARPGRA